MTTKVNQLDSIKDFFNVLINFNTKYKSQIHFKKGDKGYQNLKTAWGFACELKKQNDSITSTNYHLYLNGEKPLGIESAQVLKILSNSQHIPASPEQKSELVHDFLEIVQKEITKVSDKTKVHSSKIRLYENLDFLYKSNDLDQFLIHVLDYLIDVDNYLINTKSSKANDAITELENNTFSIVDVMLLRLHVQASNAIFQSFEKSQTIIKVIAQSKKEYRKEMKREINLELLDNIDDDKFYNNIRRACRKKRELFTVEDVIRFSLGYMSREWIGEVHEELIESEILLYSDLLIKAMYPYPELMDFLCSTVVIRNKAIIFNVKGKELIIKISELLGDFVSIHDELTVNDRKSDLETQQLVKENTNYINNDVKYDKYISNMPFKNSNYVSNSKVEQDVIDKINSKQSVVLVQGIGGSGKSSLCTNLYYELQDSFDYLGWIDYKESLEHDMVEQLKLKNIINGEIISFESFSKLKEVLLSKDFRNTVIFIDNMDTFKDDKLVELFKLPCKFVVNSRYNISSDFEIINLPKLDMDASKLMFYKYCKLPQDDDICEEMIENALNQHPLTIELISKSANKYKHLTLEEFYLFIKESGYSSLKSEISSNGESKEGSVQDLVKSVFKVMKLTPNENKILINLSLVPNIKIPFTHLQNIFGDTFTTEIDSLIDQGWITHVNNYIIVHNVVSESLVEYQSEKNDYYDQFVTNILDLTAYKKGYNVVDIKVYAEIAMKLLNNLPGSNNSTLARLSTSIGTYYDQLGKFEASNFHYKNALKLELSSGECSNKYISIYHNNLALNSYRKREFSIGIGHSLKDIALKEGDLYSDQDYKNIFQSYNMLGVLYMSTGEITNALGTYLKALRKRVEYHENIEKCEDAIGLVLLNIGMTLYNTNKVTLAYEVLTNAREILEKSDQWFKNSNLASVMTYLSYIDSKRNEESKAIDFAKMSLFIRSNFLNNHNYLCAYSYDAIGKILYQSKDATAAKRYFDIAYETRLNADNGSVNEVVHSYDVLSEFFYLEKDLLRSEEYATLYSQAMKSFYGENHLKYKNAKTKLEYIIENRINKNTVDGIDPFSDKVKSLTPNEELDKQIGEIELYINKIREITI